MSIRIALAALLVPLTAGCVQQTIARSEVESALLNAGLPPATSRCMAHHMVDQLTIKQLGKLKALQGAKRSVGDYLAAVERMNDPEVIRVTIGSAGACGSASKGWTD